MINDNWPLGVLALIGSYVTTLETMGTQINQVAAELQKLREEVDGRQTTVPTEEGQKGHKGHADADEGR